jgi:hypothetical protein
VPDEKAENPLPGDAHAMINNDPSDKISQGLARLSELTAMGADLSLPRWQTHRFSGHPEQLDSVSVALRHAGYMVVRDDSDELTATSFAVADEARLRENMHILCRVADHFEVSFDSWSAGEDGGVQE